MNSTGGARSRMLERLRKGGRPTIYCDSASNYARSVFSEMDVILTSQPREADLLWVRDGYEQFFDQLRPSQLLNHFPGESAITDKGDLAGYLHAFDRHGYGTGLALRDFYPETYRLYVKPERDAFLAGLPARDTEENLWVLKPTYLADGKGVRILWRFDELRLAAEALEKGNEEAFAPFRYCIAQRYIRNLLLLDGRKSETRLYWLIASLDPLLVLLYKEGTVRLNSLPFKLGEYDNPLIHVTNVYQQKQHPNYDPNAILKWDYRRLQSYLTGELNIAPPDFIEAELKPRLKEILRFVVLSTREYLAAGKAGDRYFGLYGADIILDQNLRPWLTEIQLGPGLSHTDPVKKSVIPAMLREAIEITLEVRSRKQNRLPLYGFDSIRGFEWVFDWCPGDRVYTPPASRS